MATYDETLALVNEYQKKYRHEGSAKFEVNKPFDLFPGEADSSLVCDWGWDKNEYWPHADEKGVYLIFDDNLILTYVGKASMNNTIGARLYSHFGSGEVCNPRANWERRPRFLVTVKMPEGHGFEAPALEEFLIEKLHPDDNTAGRHWQEYATS